MALRKPQVGFSIIEVVVAVAVVALIAFLGYRFYIHQQAATSGEANTAQVSVPAAPEITTASDLDKAGAVLDQIDVEGSNSSDSARLDSELSAF